MFPFSVFTAADRSPPLHHRLLLRVTPALGDNERAAGCTPDVKVDLEVLPRRQLQEIAKRVNIKANQKSVDIITQLQNEFSADTLVDLIHNANPSCGLELKASSEKFPAQMHNALQVTSSKTKLAQEADLVLSWEQLHGILLEEGTDGALEYVSACLERASSHESPRSAPRLFRHVPEPVSLLYFICGLDCQD